MCSDVGCSGSNLRLTSCATLGGQQQEKAVYKGVYSDWSVEEEDVREVIAYRAGLNVAALGKPLFN